MEDKLKAMGQQYNLIKDALPIQRGNVKLDNKDVLNAILVCRREWVQVARIARTCWQLAHHLYTHEPPEQSRCIG